MAQIFFTIATAQEPHINMIIKGFATLGMVIRLDDMFVVTLPDAVK